MCVGATLKRGGGGGFGVYGLRFAGLQFCLCRSGFASKTSGAKRRSLERDED